MPNTNFEKVENILSDVLLKLLIQNLLELTDKKPKKEDSASKEAAAQKRLVQALRNDLKRLGKKDVWLLDKLEISKEEIKKFINDPSQLTAEEWKKIEQIRQKVIDYKKKLSAANGESSDAEMVEKERIRQKDRRFNVREGWKPLH